MTTRARLLFDLVTTLLAAVACVVVAFSCGPSEAVIRERVHTAANVSIVTAVEAYRADGLACVEMSSTRDESRRCRDSVEQRWAPVWRAWDRLRAGDESIAAWCALADTFPPELRPPAVEGLVCPPKGGVP